MIRRLWYDQRARLRRTSSPFKAKIIAMTRPRLQLHMSALLVVSLLATGWIRDANQLDLNGPPLTEKSLLACPIVKSFLPQRSIPRRSQIGRVGKFAALALWDALHSPGSRRHG
jgi:hypothetical protein